MTQVYTGGGVTFIFSTFKDSPYGVIGTKMSNVYVFF